MNGTFNCTKRSCYLKKSYADSYCKMDNGNSLHPKFLFCKHCSRLNLLSSQYICIIISAYKEYMLTNFLAIYQSHPLLFSFPQILIPIHQQIQLGISLSYILNLILLISQNQRTITSHLVYFNSLDFCLISRLFFRD